MYGSHVWLMHDVYIDAATPMEVGETADQSKTTKGESKSRSDSKALALSTRDDRYVRVRAHASWLVLFSSPISPFGLRSASSWQPKRYDPSQPDVDLEIETTAEESAAPAAGARRYRYTYRYCLAVHTLRVTYV